MSNDNLVVRSHVGRDLVQSAGLFKTERHVVWEYVSNGLQYVDPGVAPVVRVTLQDRPKFIRISDNGRGMDWTGLNDFFQMHGENQDRKSGRPGRGRFGTGKSAAFGIADLLRVRTVRNGKRSTVELHRRAIERVTSGSPIPVGVIECEVPTAERNGTIVDIEQVHLRSFNRRSVIEFIERHLAHWKGVTVYVNGHECEFAEPPVAEQCIFEPTDEERAQFGDVRLVVKVAKGSLDEQLRGVAIFSNGVWHETTLAGSENREMSQYIFGEIDVPALDADTSAIRPYDMSRSMQLNRSNELVQCLLTFIGPHIEETRRRLVAEQQQQRRDEERRKLAAQAREIARILNEDFAKFRSEWSRTAARASGGADGGRLGEGGIGGDDDISAGTTVPARVIVENGGAGSGFDGRRTGGETPRTLNPILEPGSDGDPPVGGPAGGPGGQEGMRRPAGGFAIEFRDLGADAYRSRYPPDERTIYINLEHPQIVAARGLGSVDDPAFRRLAYEVAFAEYAVAFAHEKNRKAPYPDAAEALYDIRDTLNRITRRGASL
jgi:hypothetical protein